MNQSCFFVFMYCSEFCYHEHIEAESPDVAIQRSHGYSLFAEWMDAEDDELSMQELAFGNDANFDVPEASYSAMFVVIDYIDNVQTIPGHANWHPTAFRVTYKERI